MISIRCVHLIFWCPCLPSLVRMSRFVAALHRFFLRSSLCLAGGCCGFDRSDVGFVAGGLHVVGGVRQQYHRCKGSSTHLCSACLVVGCMPLVLFCSFFVMYPDLGAWLLQGVVERIRAMSVCSGCFRA